MAGPLPVWISGAFGGAVTIGGLSAIGAGVYSMRSPNDSILKYELAIETDDECLLVAHGTASQTAVAREIILAARRPAELGVHWSDAFTPRGRGIVGPQKTAGRRTAAFEQF